MIESSQTLTHCESSILCTTFLNNLVFAGTQKGAIFAWNAQSFNLVCRIEAHSRSVFALSSFVDKNGKCLLFSSGDEGFVRVWDVTHPSSIVSACIIYAGPDCGDILSLAFSELHKTLYIGCKNASIQFFSPAEVISDEDLASHWTRRSSAFFYEAPLENQLEAAAEDSVELCLIREKNVLHLAHEGFVFQLVPHSFHRHNILLSGAGDGTVKVWDIDNVLPVEIRRIDISQDSVTSIAVFENYLYSGTDDGLVKIHDWTSGQCQRTLSAHTQSITALSSSAIGFASSSADGGVKQWTHEFELVASFAGHKGSALCLSTTDSSLISGGSDHMLKIWTLHSRDGRYSEVDSAFENLKSPFVSQLRKLVQFKTVSGDPSCESQSQACAKYLRSLLIEMGAESFLEPNPGGNPVVFGKFSANGYSDADSVLVYGHYDVQPAKEHKWHFPPFQLTGADGYVYGRGTSDNKGPVLALIYAASHLYQERCLRKNIVFIIEGEEETGCRGLEEAVNKNKTFLGDVGLILFSNSYWINEHTPCIVYGFRGVIHMRVTVSSPVNDDLHSGVHGGMSNEPMLDLVSILGALKSVDGSISIPEFAAKVKDVSAEDMKRFNTVMKHINSGKVKDVNALVALWRRPTITVHRINVSGPESNTVIPSTVHADISARIVANQSVAEISRCIETFLRDEFTRLQSANRIDISVGHASNWWSEDFDTRPYRIAQDVLRKHWKKEPCLVMEGGSIPAIPLLKQVFDAEAIEIPLGQGAISFAIFSTKSKNDKMEGLAAAELLNKDDPTLLTYKEVKESYGSSLNFMLAFGLKPYNAEDCEEARHISRSFKADMNAEKSSK